MLCHVVTWFSAVCFQTSILDDESRLKIGSIWRILIYVLSFRADGIGFDKINLNDFIFVTNVSQQ